MPLSSQHCPGHQLCLLYAAIYLFSLASLSLPLVFLHTPAALYNKWSAQQTYKDIQGPLNGLSCSTPPDLTHSRITTRHGIRAHLHRTGKLLQELRLRCLRAPTTFLAYLLRLSKRCNDKNGRKLQAITEAEAV